ncbi:MAG TPA: GNAT family protein [Solirubrobacteraceae bacterium]|nr:GNAT family protein [Solirubrobacteraceae bacterium]
MTGSPGPAHLSAADLRGSFSGRLVRLAPLAAEHAEGLVAAASDADMFAWMPLDMAASSDALRQWLTESLALAEAGSAVPYVILSAEDGRPLGSTRFLELRFEHLRAEIGWTWVTRPAWGTGVNVETKLLLLEHAFERVGLRRVEFKTDARNARSRGALTALGASFEGILRKHMVVREGGARDSAYFSVIDDEWPAVKAGLQARLAKATAAEPTGESGLETV